MQDLRGFLVFLRNYFLHKTVLFGLGVEKVKDLIVALLVVKRGKYSNSFLNTSFLLLTAAAFIGGPIIAENNLFLSSLDQSSNYQSSTITYDPYENSLETVISNKPRSSILDYTVIGGDTMGSIAQKYGVSIDTIKWASNLKTDTIKPGQKLKIPPVSGVVHKVILGENIYTIAKKYKTDAQKIVNFPFNDFNDLTTFSLSAGQTLFVPDGIPVEAQEVYIAKQATIAPVVAGIKGSSNFIWPTSGIVTQYPAWYHMALDIANNAMPPVIASDTGTVVYSACMTYDYGCHIIIDHGNGYRTLYGHLSFLGVSAGQVVNQGQQIGVMGSTGRSTGTHLHFEIRSGSTLLNPLNFLNKQ